MYLDGAGRGGRGGGWRRVGTPVRVGEDEHRGLSLWTSSDGNGAAEALVDLGQRCSGGLGGEEDGERW